MSSGTNCQNGWRFRRLTKFSASQRSRSVLECRLVQLVELGSGEIELGEFGA